MEFRELGAPKDQSQHRIDSKLHPKRGTLLFRAEDLVLLSQDVSISKCSKCLEHDPALSF